MQYLQIISSPNPHFEPPPLACSVDNDQRGMHFMLISNRVRVVYLLLTTAQLVPLKE